MHTGKPILLTFKPGKRITDAKFMKNNIANKFFQMLFIVLIVF